MFPLALSSPSCFERFEERPPETSRIRLRHLSFVLSFIFHFLFQEEDVSLLNCPLIYPFA